jgi:hypothetical protein
MNRLDAVGLIINPKAGQGYAANAWAALAALAALRPSRIFTGPGELGASALEGIDFSQVSIVTAPDQSGRAQTQAIAAKLAQAPISAIIVIGGDGTLADVACALIGQRSAIPLLGIGAGSTNAGNLITCRVIELDRLNRDSLQVGPVRALLAYDNGQLLGIGFNDCVLGFTVVGTSDGVVCDLDAAAKMSGQDHQGSPRLIGTNRTIVQRTGPDGIQKIAGGRKIATVAVGFAEQAFFAKAVTGGICLAALVDAPAGCLVADFPLVQIGLELWEVLAIPPISSTYTTLDDSQRIRVSGARKGTAVCVDGNPLKILQPADMIEFGVAMDAVQSIRLV